MGLQDAVNKTIKVIFDDGTKITQRVGILKGFDDIYLYVDSEAIPHIKVIRWEVINDAS